ncbi:MAG TPA: sigma-70 family RNA polymerase sigma factor [Stellaceae bacterium]|nr:sigma-70 family RNA polymerase sigma factor [Stellaceae bacterium]
MEAAKTEAASDAALVCAIAGAAPGCDSRAEAELYRRLAPRVRLYGLRHLRDAQAAADLTQQVLLMTIEKLRAGALRDPEKLASFVLGTCRLVVLDLRRGALRREALLRRYGEEAESELPAASDTLDREKLVRCLEGLAERERSVLIASFFSEKSAAEVGQALGLSGENVRVIRHRALRRLRDCMGIAGGTP